MWNAASVRCRVSISSNGPIHTRKVGAMPHINTISAHEIFPIDSGPFHIGAARKLAHWERLPTLAEDGPLFLCGEYWFDREMPRNFQGFENALFATEMAQQLTFPELPYPTCQFAFLTTFSQSCDRLVLVNAAFKNGYLNDGVGYAVEPNSPLFTPANGAWLTICSLVLVREICKAIDSIPRPDYSHPIGRKLDKVRRLRNRPRVPFIDLSGKVSPRFKAENGSSMISRCPHERRAHQRHLKSGKVILTCSPEM